MSLDRDDLARSLQARFGGSDGEARTVARMADDLAAAGQLTDDRGHPLTEPVVLEELADAPEGTPADRWNWWVGSLEVAFGGYEQFSVRRFRR